MKTGLSSLPVPPAGRSPDRRFTIIHPSVLCTAVTACLTFLVGIHAPGLWKIQATDRQHFQVDNRRPRTRPVQRGLEFARRSTAARFWGGNLREPTALPPMQESKDQARRFLIDSWRFY